MRELETMYMGKMRSQWLMVGELAATVHNANPFREGQSVAPNDFIPKCFRYGRQPRTIEEAYQKPEVELTHRDLFRIMSGAIEKKG